MVTAVNIIVVFPIPLNGIETTVGSLTRETTGEFVVYDGDADDGGTDGVPLPNPAALLRSILSAETELAFIGAARGSDGGAPRPGIISQLVSQGNVSNDCLHDVSTYCQDLLTLKGYALKSK